MYWPFGAANFTHGLVVNKKLLVIYGYPSDIFIFTGGNLMTDLL